MDINSIIGIITLLPALFFLAAVIAFLPHRGVPPSTDGAGGDRSFGFFLKLFAFGQVVSMLKPVAFLGDVTLSGGQPLDPPLRGELLAWATAATVISLIAQTRVASLYFSKDVRAPRAATIFCGYAMISYLMEFELIHIAISVPISMAWISYFRTSPDMHRVFLVPRSIADLVVVGGADEHG